MAQTGLQKLFVRILLFQFIVFIGVFQSIHIDDSSKHFFENYSDGKNRLKIDNDYGIENILKTNDKYTIIYTVYLSIMIAFAVLSVLTNQGIFKLLTAILFGFVSFVTYNPLLPNNIISSNNIYGIRHELIISVGIVIGIVLNMTLPCYIDDYVEEKEKKKVQDETPNEGKEIELPELKDTIKEKDSKKTKGKKNK